MKETIKKIASEIKQELLAIRHHLHANPELSFQEYKTADFVERKLKEWGYTPQRVTETGIIAVIEGSKPGKVVALRADMDALPIQETNNVPYKSLNDGIMHACGHDVHTTCLLGVAFILQKLQTEIKGTYKLIFQPGEEKIPGGANILIQNGVLENPKVDCIIGQHVMPLIKAGKVGFREGLYMASADEIYMTVKGKGGHGAMPQMNIDPVLITSHIIVALQQIVSRNAHPVIPTVLSFGKVIANGATNVIPDSVYVEGTLRTLDENWRIQAHQKIRKIATGIAESMGATVDIDIQIGYPFLKNDPNLTRETRNAAAQYLGTENIENLDIWMAAEDFSYYSHKVPACFYRLGTRNESKGITHSVHTSKFDIDEDAIEIGVGMMAWVAVNHA